MKTEYFDDCKLNRDSFVKLVFNKFDNRTDDITKLTSNVFDEILKELTKYEYEIDDRFYTYGRRDFLEVEIDEYLKEGNIKDAWWNFDEYIRADIWISGLDFPDELDFKLVTKENEEYKNDGIICMQEKDRIIAMLNKMKGFLLYGYYIEKLGERYKICGLEEKWKHMINVSYGISDEDKKTLLQEYPGFPKELMEILEKIDGTYHRKYGDEKISFYFFGADLDNGEYPYYLCSAKDIIKNKNSVLEIKEIFSIMEESDFFVDEKISIENTNIKWINFADCMNNGGTSKLYIDLTPSPKGKVGQIVRYMQDPENLTVIADSFADFLELIVENEFKFIKGKELKDANVIKLDEKKWIQCLNEYYIDGTKDILIITEKVKLNILKHEEGTTISFSINIPYQIIVNDIEYNGIYELGDSAWSTDDNNPIYNVRILDLNNNGQVKVIISHKNK